MSGPRLISESVPRIAGKIFSRKYIMLGRLVTHWAEIVGADLADKTQPVKIRRISKGQGQQAGVSLDIATTTADATVMHYRKDLILERINQIFGEKLVTAIRFVPIAANAPSPVRKKRLRLLSPQQNRDLTELISQIKDPEIQKSLENLGKAVMQDSR